MKLKDVYMRHDGEMIIITKFTKKVVKDLLSKFGIEAKTPDGFVPAEKVFDLWMRKDSRWYKKGISHALQTRNIKYSQLIMNTFNPYKYTVSVTTNKNHIDAIRTGYYIIDIGAYLRLDNYLASEVLTSFRALESAWNPNLDKSIPHYTLEERYCLATLVSEYLGDSIDDEFTMHFDKYVYKRRELLYNTNVDITLPSPIDGYYNVFITEIEKRLMEYFPYMEVL